MTTREHINDYFNGRPFMVLCALALVVTAATALSIGVSPAADEFTGLFFSFKGSIIESGPLSAAINVLCILLTGGILLAVNKLFTFARSMTHLFASAYFLLQLAYPQGLVSLHAGTLICLVTALTLPVLFATYQDRHSQRRVFLISALLSAGCLFHYGFLFLIPAFVIGYLYMGVLNLKGMLATLFGLVTPMWIVLGLGIASPSDVVAPLWMAQQWPTMSPTLVLAAVTAMMGIVLAAINLHTIMNYRMQTRVYNMFFIIVLMLALIALCLNPQAINVYLPLLSLMVAVQVALVHSLRTSPYRYIFLLLLIAACAGCCIVNLMPS